jgi:tetratricopeptide (TPR) repeat protein
MENDTLAEALVDYFDRHGSANERMRAKYILGRTYYCLGELPRALETYMEAADCADTTAADCDFAKLSRIHAQSAVIFNQQVQPRSQLRELRLAEHYAWKGLDTLQAIECYAQEADAYDFLHQHDSIIYILERAARMFSDIGRLDRASQTISTAILSLIARDDLLKARTYCNIYEERSGFFDKDGNIEEGREVYYYIKGKYYLAVNRLDSAEFLFRKELRDGKDLNNQIAGCKGLQEVFVEKKNPDSIAKYATLSYELNDSAYSLAEMQSIQKMQASYNFNHHKYLANQKESEAKIAWLTSILIVIVSVVLLWFFFRRYWTFRNAALDYRLRNAKISRRFHDLAKSQPIQYPTWNDWQDLRSLVEYEIPSFKSAVNPDESHPLSEMDYDVCVSIRVQLTPIEIAKLKQCSPATITKIRKRLLSSVFGKEGNTDDFDDFIGKIGYR